MNAVITDSPTVATVSGEPTNTPPKWIDADRKMTRIGRSPTVTVPTSSPPALPARARTYSMRKKPTPQAIASSSGAPTDTTAAR